MCVSNDGSSGTEQRTAALPSIWREPLTRSEGFFLAALIVALVWASISYAQRHRPVLVISEPESGATRVIT
jgi:hypothetical protein